MVGMKAPPTPAPAPEPPKTIPFPTPARPPGRPKILTDALIDEICTAIRIDGMSDTGAGDLAGVSRASISRWKQDDEDFQVALRQARAQFEQERLRMIRGACKRDGMPDWRAHGWLLQQSSPEKYGYPGRRRPAPKPEKEEPPRDPNVITPEDLVLLQQRRAIALRPMKEAFLAEQAQKAAEAAAAAAAGQAEPEAPPAAVPGHSSGPVAGWGSAGFASPEPPKSDCANRSKTP